MTWRSTAFDAARVALIVDPPWLLAPLLVRERSSAPALESDWDRWLTAAVAFRPGGAAPRAEDLVAFSPALSQRWREMRPGIQRSLDSPPPAAQVVPVEQQRLDTFRRRTGREPAPRMLIVLVVPFGAGLFLRPEHDRLVVDTALRLSGEHYLSLLDPVLAEFF